MDAAYCRLVWLGAVLVVTGLVALMFLIPATGLKFKHSDARTEFFSARAASWCVTAGVIVLLLAAFGMLFRGVVLALR